MQNVFMKTPLFGELLYHHMYLFYEEPQIFSCINPKNQIFLLVAIPSENCRSWLVTQVSEQRLAQLEGNQISIRNALIESEFPVWCMQEYEKACAASPVSAASLPEAFLPKPDTYVDYKEDSK